MNVFSVTDFIAHVNSVLAKCWHPEDLCVEGEVSSFRVSQGQWVNFDLKDKDGLAGVFMSVWQMHTPIEDGMKVRVYGMPRIYPKFGKFSITANKVELVGDGALAKALAALRARLEKEGLFESTRKRELPKFPERIALIASKESAAYGDFVRIVDERWRGLEIDLYHVKVQGVGAAEDVAKAIESANLKAAYDALVLTRGGGSLEELMAFNDEQVVRAIHASKIPTLVGIGHERDLTLAEEAADVRGSTPTDCARRLVPDRNDVLRHLAYQTESIESSLLSFIETRKQIMVRAMRAPAVWILRQKKDLSDLVAACNSNVRQWFKVLQDKYRADVRLLASLDPKGVLARGYSMLRGADGRAITTISRLTVGMEIAAVLKDGEGNMLIKSVKPIIKQQKLL